MIPILIVEDDAPLAFLVSTYLGRHGYFVTTISRGDEAISAIQRLKPHLVILDVMLPGLDGLQVCRLVRNSLPELPILMLTALEDTHDQVLGLESGADDYVSKPCEPRVLLARVRTLLRRCKVDKSTVENSQFVLGELRLLPLDRQAWWRGKPLELSSTEFNLLSILVSHAGEVLSRDDLVRELRGIEFNGLDRTVDVTISKLRRRFEESPGEVSKIKTIWGKGYLLSRAGWD